MRNKYIVFIGFLVSLLFSVFCIEYIRWKHLWSLESPLAPYAIKHSVSDTIKIVMIGDSWVEQHEKIIGDSVYQKIISGTLGHTVSFQSSGKSGAKCRDVYHMMFETGQYGTMPLLSQGPDFGIIIVGINDAAANIGTRQFCYYYQQIIDFMLTNKICPIVVELPDVTIPKMFNKKTTKDRIVDWMRSVMTRCSLYNFSEYRYALNEMLKDDSMMDVVFVNLQEWNKRGFQIEKELFMGDGVHLNHRGYERLDSCIASTILKRMKVVI
ncbi:MAG: SGNH/GDSL hydrolase family protein [Prevotella sp.]|nr:SGNH/GDSL hydrolase family protein [Prevotella sp.]